MRSLLTIFLITITDPYSSIDYDEITVYNLREDSSEKILVIEPEPEGYIEPPKVQVYTCWVCDPPYDFTL